MGIEVMRSELVKPCEATPQGPFWLSNLDLGVRSGYSPTIYLFRPNGHGGPGSSSSLFSVDVLRTALARALVPFYPLAGRLATAHDGRLEIDCNAEGAVFVVAQSDAVLDDLEQGFSPASKAMRDLFVPPCPKEAGPGSPLLLLQVTLLRGGGVVLGTGMHHYALDGRSSFHFIQTWSSIARGGAAMAIEPPFLDRSSLRARSPPLVLFDHSHEYLASPTTGSNNNNNSNNNNKPSSEPPLTGAILRVSSAQASALRARTGGESLFRSLAAHLWRCACRARGLPHDAKSRLYTVVDMRARLAPPLPGAYLGNAGARTSVAAKVGDLVASPLGFGARRLRVATGKGDDYARSLVDYLETSVLSGSSGPGRELPDTDVRVISWMGMASHDADFGWGAPALVAPAAMSYTWFVYSVGDGTGDVAVAVAMKEEHMERFKELFFDEKEMAAWPVAPADGCDAIGGVKAF